MDGRASGPIWRGMGYQIAAAVAAGLVALAVFAGWRGSRPPNPHKGPRLMPWRMIMMLSAAVALIVAVETVAIWKAG